MRKSTIRHKTFDQLWNSLISLKRSNLQWQKNVNQYWCIPPVEHYSSLIDRLYKEKRKENLLIRSLWLIQIRERGVAKLLLVITMSLFDYFYTSLEELLINRQWLSSSKLRKENNTLIVFWLRRNKDNIKNRNEKILSKRKENILR